MQECPGKCQSGVNVGKVGKQYETQDFHILIKEIKKLGTAAGGKGVRRLLDFVISQSNRLAR